MFKLIASIGRGQGGVGSILSSRCLLLVLALVLVGGNSGGQLEVSGHEEHQEVANHEVTLKNVCANRQVPIISVDVVRRLINELANNPGECQDSYSQSFYELEPILAADVSNSLCSEHKFNQIKEYHFRYINPLVESYKFGDNLNSVPKKIANRPLTADKFDYTVQLDDYKQEILIPISLSQFFKAWALQVSGMCKRTLVDNLDKAMQIMSDMDIEMLEGKALEASPSSLNDVGRLFNDQVDTTNNSDNELQPSIRVSRLSGSSDTMDSESLSKNALSKKKKKKDEHGFNYGLTFQKLVYLPELEGELEEADIERRQTTKVLDLRSKPELDKFMHACQHRFKPIYERLIMPIVRLAKLGYEYVGPAIDDIRPKLYQDPTVARWMLVTMVCESQGSIELVNWPEGSEHQVVVGPRLEYEPVYNYKIEGNIWIKGAEALRKELDRISGEHSTGFKKFLYKAGIAGRKAVAIVDPHQSAWYRRNQNTLSSFLNSMSIISNLASIGVSISG